MKKKIQTIKNWFPILKWDSMINFGDCGHLNKSLSFDEMYYACDELLAREILIKNGLEIDRTGDLRLVGVAGCGKSSFLYYMKRSARLEEDNILNKYYFYIFKTTKAVHKNYKKLIRYELINCLEKYYSECGLDKDFDIITNCNRENNLKEKINKLINFYKSNKTSFNKKLIFVLDEVDLLEDDDILKISSSVRNDLDARTFMKLICIRPSTLKKQNKEITKLMDQFFPKPYFMPPTPLFNIVQFRINMQTNGGVNPFSEELCELIDDLFDGNKRDGLSTLESILENTLPKGIHKNTSEKFIQKYIFNVSINYLIDSCKLPNLHDDYFRNIVNYPIVVDLLMSVAYQPNLTLLFGTLNDIAKYRSRNVNIHESDRVLKLISDNFLFSIEKMENQDLVEYVDKKSIKLTTKGEILLEYVQRDHYHTKCRSLIPNRKINKTYWKLLRKKINHESVAFNYQSWRDPYVRKI